MEQLDQENLGTAKAYQMRLCLQDIYRLENVQAARHRFLAWCRWVRWVAKKHVSHIFLAMLKVAKMIETNLQGILAHWKWRLTNAFMEGLNSVFQTTKRKARGYRSSKHLITMLYFVAGKLRLPHSNSTENSDEPKSMLGFDRDVGSFFDFVCQRPHAAFRAGLSAKPHTRLDRPGKSDIVVLMSMIMQLSVAGSKVLSTLLNQAMDGYTLMSKTGLNNQQLADVVAELVGSSLVSVQGGVNPNQIGEAYLGVPPSAAGTVEFILKMPPKP
jgi:hypothetical protein